jgi:hypothetical protein
METWAAWGECSDEGFEVFWWILREFGIMLSVRE